jgi:uncharacterized membrane protein
MVGYRRVEDLVDKLIALKNLQIERERQAIRDRDYFAQVIEPAIKEAEEWLKRRKQRKS